MITAFIGTTELLLIGGLALLLVGGKKLPEMMRGLGKGVKEFKEGMKEVSPDAEPEQMDCKKDRPLNNPSDSKE
ncbi:MAG: twin-arginine translocase TatA/TatE family subunit [Muribaculaceae bacterium]|nr:twin-arginine translocase TatA/TatE family subunit [Muribaculaceae bacterium]